MNIASLNTSTTTPASPASVAGSPESASVKGIAVQAAKALTEAAVPPLHQVHNAAALLNRHAAASSASVSYAVDDSTKQVVVTVRDTETNDVIRQIPDKEALALSQALHQGAVLKAKA